MTTAACRIWTNLGTGARLAQALWPRGGLSHTNPPCLPATGGRALASMRGAISLPLRHRPCGDPPAMAARLLAGSLLLMGMCPAGDLSMQTGGQEAGASTPLRCCGCLLFWPLRAAWLVGAAHTWSAILHYISFQPSVVTEQDMLSVQHVVVPDLFQQAVAVRCSSFWCC